jgi:hypothetical protein
MNSIKNNYYHKKHLVKPHTIFFLFVFLNIVSYAQLPGNTYNIIWTTQSKNASESMPCGGGDIGLNVWVENGELLVLCATQWQF